MDRASSKYGMTRYIGAGIGAIMGIAITLGMDMMFGEALGGTWRDTIAADMSRLAGYDISPGSIAVYAGYAVIVILMASIGAGMGALFGAMVGRFLRFLAS